MAQDERIDEIRTEIEGARWEVFCGLDDVSRQIDLGARVRQSIRTEPWKWIAVIAVSGLVAGKLVPMLLRRSAKGWAAQFGGQVARHAIAAAIPLLATMAGEALDRRRRGNLDRREAAAGPHPNQPRPKKP